MKITETVSSPKSEIKNENGAVSLDGQPLLTLPQGMSMLTFLGNKATRIYQGAEYRDDYLVYLDGVAIDKWFVEMYGWKT